MTNERVQTENYLAPTRDLPLGRLEQRKEHLISEVRGQSRTSWSRPRVVLAAAFGVLVLGASVAAGGYVLRSDEVRSFDGIGCFAEADEDSDVAVIDANGADPVELCRQIWDNGGFGPAAGTPVDLSACVLHSGAVGVFPASGEDACQELGLSELPADFASTSEALAELESALGWRFLQAGCVDHADSAVLAREELDERGLLEWQVREEPGPSGEGHTSEFPCASFGLAPADQTIHLYFFERPTAWVACLEQPSLDAKVSVGSMGGPAAVDQCALLWSAGVLGDGTTPPLTDCLADEYGSAIVVPAGDGGVCEGLGLEPWAPPASWGMSPPKGSATGEPAQEPAEEAAD